MMIDLGEGKYVRSTEVVAVYSIRHSGMLRTTVRTRDGREMFAPKWSPKDLALEIDKKEGQR